MVSHASLIPKFDEDAQPPPTDPKQGRREQIVFSPIKQSMLHNISPIKMVGENIF